MLSLLLLLLTLLQLLLEGAWLGQIAQVVGLKPLVCRGQGPVRAFFRRWRVRMRSVLWRVLALGSCKGGGRRLGCTYPAVMGCGEASAVLS